MSTISARPTGQDPQSKLLWDILRQLDRLSSIVAAGSASSSVTIANGADVAEGHTTDAYNLATDSTAVTVISALKAVSYLLQNTLKMGIADGADVTLGAKADAKNAATDTTAISAMSVLKEISYLLQTAESAANTARTTATIVIPTQLVGPSGYPGDVNIANELKTFNPPASMLSEYRSPTDFAVAYTSNVTLTVTGAPFTVDDTVCRVQSILFKKVDGLFYGLYNGRGGVSIACASGVITVSGAGTPFTNTDILYDVNIVAAKKAYDPTTDTNKITNQNPDSLQYVLDSIVDTTNSTASTLASPTYYPSSTGMAMDGYKDCSVTGKLIDASGLTMSIEVTNDEATDGTADWIQVYVDDTKNKTMVNQLSTVNDTFAWSLDNLNYSMFRFRVIYGSSTNTSIIKLRRKAL